MPKEGNYREAIARYTRVIEVEPEQAGAYINRGAAYESAGNLDLALQDLDTALSLGSWPEAYHIRGYVHFKRGDFDKAVLDFSEAIRLDAGDSNAYTVSAYTYRGHSYQFMACYDHALRDYRKALELFPKLSLKRASLYLNVGIVYAALGEHDLAIEQYNEALARNRNDARIYLHRGDSHGQAGALDQAIEDLGKAIDLDPEDIRSYILRGSVFQSSGDFERASQDYDKALECLPDSGYVYSLRGSLYLARGDLDCAVQDFDAALERGMEDSYTYSERGVAYELKGDLDRAMEDYNRALCLRPNVAAFFNRGIGMLRLGQWKQARSDLRSASNMGIDLVEAFRADCGSVAEFEGKYNVKMPPDLAEMLTIEEEIPADAGASILAMFEELRKSVPESAFDALPTDGAKNYKHYLYGHPKR